MTDNIWITESLVEARDDGKRYRIYDSEPYETYTDKRKRLFIDLQREHGPCKGSIYRDGSNGKPIRVGWVFEKRVKYDRSNECYTREAWVKVVTPDMRPVQVVRKFHLPVNLDTGAAVI